MTVTATVTHYPTLHIKGAGLDPEAGVLDTAAHPAILKRLVALAPHEVKVAFRAVSRTTKGLADDALFSHVVVMQWGSAVCYDKGRDNTSLFALLTPDGDKLPGKPMVAGNPKWTRRLAHTTIMDSTVRLPSFQWETMVHNGRPRVVRRLISGGLWRASTNLTAVDLLVLSPLSLSCKLGQDMLTASLVSQPKKHVINVLLDPAYRGSYFPVGSAGERHANSLVLIFSPLHGALYRHLYYPGDDDAPVPSRIMNLTSPGEDLFDSLAAILTSGVYSTYTFVGLYEVDHHVIGAEHYLPPQPLKARIVNVVRARQHRSSAMGLPPQIQAAELEKSLQLVSHHDYRVMVGAKQYEIETWPDAPARFWAP